MRPFGDWCHVVDGTWVPRVRARFHQDETEIASFFDPETKISCFNCWEKCLVPKPLLESRQHWNLEWRNKWKIYSKALVTSHVALDVFADLGWLTLGIKANFNHLALKTALRTKLIPQQTKYTRKQQTIERLWTARYVISESFLSPSIFF